MKKVVFILAIVVVVVAAVSYFKKTDQKAFEKTSCERVEKVFTGLIDGPMRDEGQATAQWMYGRKGGISREDSDNFYTWLKKKGLTIKIQSYELISSQLVGGDDVMGRRVEIRCKINGVERKLIVRHKMPVEWAD